MSTEMAMQCMERNYTEDWHQLGRTKKQNCMSGQSLLE